MNSNSNISEQAVFEINIAPFFKEETKDDDD